MVALTGGGLAPLRRGPESGQEVPVGSC